jgi:hypothetical protein
LRYKKLPEPFVVKMAAFFKNERADYYNGMFLL